MDRNLQSNYILTLGGSTRVYGDDSGEYNSHHRMSTDMSRIVMVDDTCTGSAKWERTRGLAIDIHMHVVELRTGWVVKLSHLNLFSHIAGE
jgi:hypothetical protein